MILEQGLEHSRCGAPAGFGVRFPGRHGERVLVRRVAPPQTLNECRCRNPTPDQMLLSLLLLNLQREARSENSLQRRNNDENCKNRQLKSKVNTFIVRSGSIHRVFLCYVCGHRLHLSFMHMCSIKADSH